ncbi:hypothetical protein VPNG_09065 [Cytospora leucostoma]|uniref:Uncharacterized protein n=1 Tax=Cytospora leucostoma TaxID=1230097 RepID=A0A423VZE0_9PEZI|nr:hypothetical protein VPNG_09065 [Cytospora leucostoma]
MAYVGPAHRLQGVYCRKHWSPIGYPLLSSRYDYMIWDVCVQATLTETYEAQTNVEREVSYIFEVPPEASVTYFVAEVGNTRVEAIIEEKGVADETYKQATSAGFQAWKLHKISLGNVSPNSRVKVCVDYGYVISSNITEDSVRLTIPCGLADRPGDAPAKETTVPTAPTGSDAVTITVGIQTTIDDRPIMNLNCLSHHASIRPGGHTSSYRRMKPAEARKVKRDSEAYVELISDYHESIFNIYAFDTTARHLLSSQDSLRYHEDNVAFAKTKLITEASGGTNIAVALKTVLARRNRSRKQCSIIVTDELDWSVKSATSVIKEATAEAAKSQLLRVFVMGLGDHVSRGMCEALARAGSGATAYVSDSLLEDRDHRREKAQTMINAINFAPICARSIDWGMKLRDPPPSASGRMQEGRQQPDASRLGPKAKGHNFPPPSAIQQAPKPGTMFWATRSHWYAIIDGAPSDSKVTITYDVAGGASGVTHTVDHGAPGGYTDDRLVHRLAARALIQTLEESLDESEVNNYWKELEIARLGKTYNLASTQTSFVATMNGVGYRSAVTNRDGEGTFWGVPVDSGPVPPLDFLKSQAPKTPSFRNSSMSGETLVSISAAAPFYRGSNMSNISLMSFAAVPSSPHTASSAPGDGRDDLSQVVSTQDGDGAFDPDTVKRVLFRDISEKVWLTICVIAYFQKKHSNNGSALSTARSNAERFVNFVASSVYRHRQNRLKVMIRGAVISLLHDRVLTARDGEGSDGKVVTFMSNDVSSIEDSADLFHETWAYFVEVIVGTVLLAGEVGGLWPVPLVFIFLCSRMSRHVAKNLRARQGKWNAATQQRITVTSSLLASIKNVKMLGMQEAVTEHVEELRRREMDAARGVRWLMVAYNASANALGMFAPVLTIALYAGLAMLRGQALDVDTAFTTVAILSMVTHPANMVMTNVPKAVVSYSSYERIQEYLLDKTRPSRAVDTSKASGNGATSTDSDRVAVRLEDVAIAGTEETKPILKDINLELRQGTIVICTGPVGSGKTTLARAILGELPLSQGHFQLSPRKVSYCAQTPWLPNQSIKKVICGPTADGEDHDETWYQKTIQACSLDSDMNLLPDGDATSVGSKGMNLSGGQRQRVALARAVYSRSDLVILDDSLSALDGKTQRQVVYSLLGPHGIFRNHQIAVFWITTATQYFDLADEVVVLAEGTVKERGTWGQLRKDDPLIDEIIHPHHAENGDKEPENSVGGVVREKKSTTGNAAARELSRKNGDLSLYSYYFTSAGLGNVLAMVLCTALCAFFNNIPSYWLKLWTDAATAPRTNAATAAYIAVYVLLLLLAWTSTNGIAYTSTLRVAPTSGLALHSRLLKTVTSAPLLYFSGRDAGATLNLFSQDVQLVDKQLAQAAQSLSVQVFKLAAQAAYLRTSRQLRLLELGSRAAVASAFLEAAQGAATLRAFGWARPASEAMSCGALDGSQRPSYLLLCLQRWLGVVLDLLVAGIAVACVSLAVRSRGGTTGGQVGVALNMVLVANATLLSLVTSWTNLEISLGAVARLKEVEEDTPQEEEDERDEQPGGQRPLPDSSWPARGLVELTGVTAQYGPAAVALRGVDLTIEPGQTAVLCGRTGSGKSSVVLTLLGLLDTTEGAVAVDGVDVGALSRAAVRQRAFITVAQEAFFLPEASLRFNLDPELGARPAVLVAALRRTGLWGHFIGGEAEPDEKEEEILSRPFSSLPSLSVGQTQLLALARALVRRSVLCDPSSSRMAYSDSNREGARPIVLLDEVTSSLDPETESKIYDIISEEFVQRGHTVLMVTHKLDAVRSRLRSGKDVVVRLAEGKVERIEVVG